MGIQRSHSRLLDVPLAPVFDAPQRVGRGGCFIIVGRRIFCVAN
jgi:hypothetical protein